MKTLRYACGFIAVIPLVGSAAELKDPRTRDEDISGTRVEVTYELRGDGLYEYVYSVAAPADNLGYVSTFLMDLSCSGQVPGTTPPLGSGQGYLGNFSDDGKHVPATVSADYGQAATYGVSAQNKAQWAVTLRAGESSTGLRVLSPASPGLREYQLVPYMDNDPSWDYPKEPDPTIPWIDDFTVVGVAAGPGCPGVSPPVEEPLFAGSGNAQVEPENINMLLAYKEPMRDKITVDATTEVVPMDIVYSNDIDSKTFKVQPGHLRPLFDPRAGTTQRVEIPLKAAKNMVHFEVRSSSDRGRRNDDDDSQSYKDRDRFEFRRK